MMSVLFPTGVRVTYNEARFLRYVNMGIELYTADPTKDQKARWVVTIPASTGCIVEAEPASKTVIPGQLNDAGLGEKVLDRLRHIPSWRLKELKTALNEFDARSKQWKD
ncbi:MAG: hypothetical protein KA314_04945 [Chloroflexi bacterium]|nr:hypothetical protein [Chloroflexota bacterium]